MENTYHNYKGPEWAEWYDCFFGAYTDDFDFMMKQGKSAKGPVLEVGCGTGRLLLPLLQEGTNIRGFDVSADLLRTLREKAAALKIKKPPVKKASMTNFRYKERFERILVAFRTINHCADPESQIAALKNFRRHLRPGGQCILSTYVPHPDDIVNADNSIRVTGVVENPQTGEPVMVSHYTADIDSTLQSRTDVWIFEELPTPQNDNPRRIFLPVTLRWIYVSEMSLLLKLAGFKHAEVYGGFDLEPLDSASDEQVWIATK